MATSRSAKAYLARKGLTDETLRPAPRLDVSALLVHTVPLDNPPRPAPYILREFEGNPSPDRIGTRPWADNETG